MSAFLRHFIGAFCFKYISRLCFSESRFFLCSQLMWENCLFYVIYNSICKTRAHQDSVVWQNDRLCGFIPNKVFENSNIWSFACGYCAGVIKAERMCLLIIFTRSNHDFVCHWTYICKHFLTGLDKSEQKCIKPLLV